MQAENTQDKAKKLNRKRLTWMLPLALLALFIVFFLVYASDYYHADATAEAALVSDEAVTVTQTTYGWFFDGPSEETALVFYPGAKVDEKAYAPLLHQLATRGMDAFLMSMPFHFAFLSINAADSVIGTYNYAHWYVGGHSLGGAMASEYAASHSDNLDGVVLLGAFSSEDLDDALTEILIYGSEDHIVSLSQIEQDRETKPDNYVEHVIEGGNHAQFGNYGTQAGDGEATISATEQQTETIQVIMSAIS